MDITITPNGPLNGSVTVQGGKNAALPLIAASLLSSGPVTLRNVPRISDVLALLKLMESLGTRSRWHTTPGTLELHTPTITSTRIGQPDGDTGLRASFNLIGPLLARTGEAWAQLPGGCTFQDRPIDQHIHAFKALGYTVTEEQGGYLITRPRNARSGQAHVYFDLPTVGGSQNALCAAAAHPNVIIDHLSPDPDVQVLLTFLGRLGVNVTQRSHSVALRGLGRTPSTAVLMDVPGDRLEAGTFLLAAYATSGHISVRGAESDSLRGVISKLSEWGAQIQASGRNIEINAERPIQAGNLVACEFPGFPTDLQPLAMAAAAARGQGLHIRDRIYPDRASHLPSLRRMGADIDAISGLHVLNSRAAPLRGASLEGRDIRATSGLLIAGLAAESSSTLSGGTYLQRGHESITEKLNGLGAQLSVHSPS